MAAETQRDRTTPQLELTRTPWPAPPLNLFVTSGYQRGVFDLRWDDPLQSPLNGRFQVLGVNVYRSFDSEFGPFTRLTELPVGAMFWRDETDNELVVEDVTNQFVVQGHSGTGAVGPRYIFRTLRHPIVREGSQAVTANLPDDVRVYINGTEVGVLSVRGDVGEVEIDSYAYTDPNTMKPVFPLVPGNGAQVLCVYRHNKSLLKTELATRVFYRVTTVGVLSGTDLSTVSAQDLLETPLESAAATHNLEIEKLDYMWREAIERNRWILQQGGEWVKVFIRKTVGVPCVCVRDDYHKQGRNDCPLCWGTAIIGGYEGPYDILIAPDDAEKRISQKEQGRTVEHSYEVWTGPTPLLSMRDFLVKINGERYSIGPVRMPTNRGNVLQQHFNIGHLDEKDIRYSVPVGNPVKYAATQFKPSGPELEADASITDKQNIPAERQLRGRSKAWENITY